MSTVSFAASADQDQATQNVQPDLVSTLSALVNSVDKSSNESAIILIIFLGQKCVIGLFWASRVSMSMRWCILKIILHALCSMILIYTVRKKFLVHAYRLMMI